MKKLLLGAAAAAMTLTGFAATASAAPYGFHGRAQYGQWNQDRQWNHDREWNQGREWNRGGEGWRAGQRFDGYRDHRRMVDWRAYDLPRPRDGYAYYRDDDGSIVMAALASGLIGLVLGQALAN